MSFFNSKLILITIIIALSLISFVIGFALGQKLISSSQPQTNTTKVNASSYFSNPIFQRQTASFLGQITKIEGQQLTLTDDNNHSATFNLAPSFIIIDHSKPTTKEASPSTNMNDIEINKPALLTLELQDNEYRVVYITYTSTTQPQASQGR